MPTKYKVLSTKYSAFTLVELLVVITILGIIVAIGLVSFRSAQERGRDAQRKSDLKQIASALELYYSDYGKYPDAGAGMILGCPSPDSGVCTWGAADKSFTDNKTLYMKVVPKDPTNGHNYLYRTVSVNSVPDTGFQLFANIENTQDGSIISVNQTCGNIPCNFAVTSPNVSASD